MSWRTIVGFAVLILGGSIIFILPEFGVPMVLFGTRLLGERFKWAAAVNNKVDKAWQLIKARIKEIFRK